MNEKLKKDIDNIVWWIPIKKLRNSLREYLLNLCIDKNDIDIIKNTIINELKDKNINIIKNSIINELTKKDKKGSISDNWIVHHFRDNIFNDENFLIKYKTLIEGLDENSINFVQDLIINKVLSFDNINDEVYLDKEYMEVVNDIENYMLNNIKEINDGCYKYKNYLMPCNDFYVSVFYEKHSINAINNLDNIKNKDIIDAGACYGESALVLSDYTNKKVHSFEPIPYSYNLMLKTIKLNNKDNIIVPVNKALSDSNGEMTFYVEDNTIIHYLVPNNIKTEKTKVSEKIELITLDKYVEENNIEVGLIKTDLEGYESMFLKGAVNTIKNQKPALLISIYHSYNDFFNIKPLIESWNLGYKFKIIKSRQSSAIAETLLIAEVY